MTRPAARGLHGQTVEMLAHRIVSGAAPQGATMDLVALRSELGISLTALREALKVLAAKGLVDARPKRGTFVRPRADWRLLDDDVLRWCLAADRSADLLEDLHELRCIVEPAAAGLAATRCTEEDLDALDAALSGMASAGDPQAAATADLRFHRRLLWSAHNELLRRMVPLLETDVAERDHIAHRAQTGSDPLPGHRAVVAAIRRRQPQQAALAVDRLLRPAGDMDVAAVRQGGRP